MDNLSFIHSSSGLISINFSKKMAKTKNFLKLSSIIQSLFLTHQISLEDNNLIIKKEKINNENEESEEEAITRIDLNCSKSEQIGTGIYFSKDNG